MSTYSQHPADSLVAEGGVSVASREFERYYSPSYPERATLLAWIDFAVEPAEEVGEADSYRLRQDFQAMAFSVTNDAIKVAMRQAGYEPQDSDAECSKYYARLRFPRRGTTWWRFTMEDKARWSAFREALHAALREDEGG